MFDIFDEIKHIQNSIEKEFEDFDRRFDRYFKGNKLEVSSREPSTEISDKGNYLKIIIDLPGLEKKDIYLKAEKDHIEIRAIKKNQIKIDKKGFFREERSIKSFYKLIHLPEEIETSKIKTKYTGSVLTILAPKTKKKIREKARIIQVE